MGADRMGLFGKTKKTVDFFALFPDGRAVESGQDLQELRENFSFSPLTISKWNLHKVDIKSFTEAAAMIASLGIPSDETIIAFGPIKLYEYPKSHNEYIANGILTYHTLVVYYYVGAIQPEFLLVELENITGLTNHGGWTATFSFNNGVHIKKNKMFDVTAPYFGLSELLGKDGHKNRRSVTLIDSLAKTLNEIKNK